LFGAQAIGGSGRPPLPSRPRALTSLLSLLFPPPFSDGRSRQFGFVGFKTAGQAADAVAYFNRAFLDSGRLGVELAAPPGSAALGRPWSRHSAPAAEAAAVAALPPGKATKTAGPTEEGAAGDDPRLDEFLALHAPRSGAAVWANDDRGLAVKAEAARPPPAAPKPDDDSEEEEEYQDLAARGGEASGDDGDGDGDGDGDASDPAAATGARSPTPPPTADPAVAGDGDDLAYLKARTVAALSSESEEEDGAESESESEEEEEEEDGADPAAPPPATPLPPPPSYPPPLPAAAPDPDAPDPAAEAALLSSTAGRLFLRNLPFCATPDDLRAALEAHGEVMSVHLVTDRLTRSPRGIAHVQMGSAASAAAARAALDGSTFQGRLLHVLPGRPAPRTNAEAAAAEGEGEDPSNPTSFKDARTASRRAGAGSSTDTASWNALYMRPDTVAEAVAAHYGVSKAELLGRDAPDAAARLALGEAHVLALTKAALAGAGVDVGVLEAAAAAPKAVRRSDAVLLVKNLPWGATAEEVASAAAPFGLVTRLVLPPTKALALLEFADPPSAGRALRGLAYRRLHHVPLYVEWAPAGAFARAAGAGDAPAALPPPPDAAGAALAGARPGAVAAAAALAAAPEPDAAAPPSSTLFVKNLSFATDDAGLAAHFKAAAAGAGGALRAARVARKKPTGRAAVATAAAASGPGPSAGYGFVELSSAEVAATVRARLQGSRLGGHALVLEFASAAAGEGGAAPPAAATPAAAPAPGAGATAIHPPHRGRTKLAVLNVAFQATRKDLAALAAPFGALKSVRLPKRASLDGSHRGYGFLDFATPSEAASALAGLTGAHLYGRRLVLQWADADADAGTEAGLDEMRAKAAARSAAEAAAGEGAGGGRPAKKRRSD